MVKDNEHCMQAPNVAVQLICVHCYPSVPSAVRAFLVDCNWQLVALCYSRYTVLQVVGRDTPHASVVQCLVVGLREGCGAGWGSVV